MNVLLIHVPKTAGTTVRDFMREKGVQVSELHFNRRMECQPCKYLDAILANPEQKVVITWRNPVEHVWSTFHFYQQYPHFHYPTNLQDFVDQLQNQQTAFLVKSHFLDNPMLSVETVDKIITLLDRPNTLCFLQDYFGASMGKLQRFLHLRNDEKSPTTKYYVRRFNFNKPLSMPKNMVEKIKANNAIDMQIYHHICSKWYSDDAVDDRTRLPDWGAPMEFPLNLVAGEQSIETYRPVLAAIQAQLSGVEMVEDYVKKWLDLFCQMTGLEPVASLEELGQLLKDTSERKVIVTRF